MVDVSIVMTTAFFGPEAQSRASVACNTAWSLLRRLKYTDGEKRLIVADDASETDWWRYFMDGNTWRGGNLEYMRISGPAKGVGASLNRACNAAFRRGDVVLYVVDDWQLEQDFDITPWVRAFSASAEPCVIRLGPPHPNTTGEVMAISEEWQGWALRLNNKSYAFGHRPALYHPRMFKYHGQFQENANAYDCETAYANPFNWAHGSDADSRCIYLALPHPWMHVFANELAGVEPGAR